MQVLLWVVGGVLIAAAALAPLRLRGARRQALTGARANAEAVYQRLGFAVETTTVADEEAVARARERWNTAGALLADADSAEQCAVAEQCAREGLAALDSAA